MTLRRNWAGRLLSISAVLFAAKIGGAMAGFLTHVLLARTLPPDDLGKYFLVISTVSLASAVAAFGYPSVMARFVSRYSLKSKNTLFLAFVRQCAGDTLRNCLLIVPISFVWMALGKPFQLTDYSLLFLMAIAIPALSMMRINGSLLTALRKYKTAYLPDVVIRPVAFLILVAIATFALDLRSWEIVLALFFLLAAIVALSQHIVLWLTFKSGPQSVPRVKRISKIWRQTSRPFLVVTIVASFFIDLQLLLVSSTLDTSAVAIIGICLKIAFLFAYMVDVIHELPARDIGDALANNRIEFVNSRIALMNAASVVISITVILLLMLSGQWLLGIFGPEYSQHNDLLMLFLLPQLIRSLSGPNVMLLTMIGAQRDIQKVYLISLLAMVIIGYICMSRFGVMGSGIGVLVFFIAVNGALSAILYRKSGLRTDALHSLKLLMTQDRSALLFELRRVAASRKAG